MNLGKRELIFPLKIYQLIMFSQICSWWAEAHFCWEHCHVFPWITYSWS